MWPAPGGRNARRGGADGETSAQALAAAEGDERPDFVLARVDELLPEAEWQRRGWRARPGASDCSGSNRRPAGLASHGAGWPGAERYPVELRQVAMGAAAFEGSGRRSASRPRPARSSRPGRHPDAPPGGNLKRGGGGAARRRRPRGGGVPVAGGADGSLHAEVERWMRDRASASGRGGHRAGPGHDRGSGQHAASPTRSAPASTCRLCSARPRCRCWPSAREWR